MYTKMIFLVCLAAMGLLAKAQDPLFTQFYNFPLNLNPAFAGCAKSDTRVSLSHKKQWRNIASPLQAYSLSVDQYYADPEASAGLVVNRYNEGYINTTHVSGILAKSFEDLNGDCRDWFFNFAVQVGYAFRNIDRSGLLFPDQLTQTGPTGLPSQAAVFSLRQKPYLDVTAGFIITTQKWMIGGTAFHLNQPVSGFTDGSDASKLPYRLNLHVSYFDGVIDNRTVLVKPTAIFQFQGTSRQFSFGSLIDFPEAPLSAGVWYSNNLAGKDNHSLSVAVNIKLFGRRQVYVNEPSSLFRAGIGYETELNRPSPNYTGGSYFLSMLYEKDWLHDDVCPKPYTVCGARNPWEFH